MAYSYEYNGENLYLGIPEPEYRPEDEPDDEPDEDRYLLFFPASAGGWNDKTGG